jgi:hypothetical protein
MHDNYTKLAVGDVRSFSDQQCIVNHELTLILLWSTRKGRRCSPIYRRQFTEVLKYSEMWVARDWVLLHSNALTHQTLFVQEQLNKAWYYSTSLAIIFYWPHTVIFASLHRQGPAEELQFQKTEIHMVLKTALQVFMDSSFQKCSE